MGRFQSSFPSKGFTLIELMVAMAVMAMLFVAASSMVGMLSQNTGTSSASLDSATQAKSVFEMIDLDLATMVRRADISNSASTNLSGFLSLLSEAPSRTSTDGSNYFRTGGEPAVVFYRLDKDTGTLDPSVKGQPVLQRAAFGALRTTNSFGMTTNSNAIAFPTPNATGGLQNTGDYENVARGVVRVGVGYLEKTNSSYIPADGSNLASHAALVVTLAIVDERAQTRSTASDLENAGAALPALTANQEPITFWNTEWKKGPPANVPKHVWNSLRFYQRTFPLQ